MDKHISEYEHPYITVDGVILRFNDTLELLLFKRETAPNVGKYELPGGFVDIDKRTDDSLRTKILEKTGVGGFFIEQLKTYDEINRDARGRVLSIAYIGLLNSDTDKGNWFKIHGDTLINCKTNETIAIEELCFDHSKILRDALKRIKNKLWYSDLIKYLLKENFIFRDLQRLVNLIEGKHINNLRRRTADRVIISGLMTSPSKDEGRPAKYLKWNDKWGNGDL